jgi:hypothetical protein
LNAGAQGQTKAGWLATLDSLWVGTAGMPGYAGLLMVFNGALINSNDPPAAVGLIVAGGRVGIGTKNPSPTARMEVSGNIKLSDNPVTPPVTDYTVTYVRAPLVDSDVATKGYVDSHQQSSCPASGSRGLRFATYTQAFTGGAFNGPKGAALLCGNQRPDLDNRVNSIHWCSVDELMELGDSYPNTETVWVRDAVVSAYYSYSAGNSKTIYRYGQDEIDGDEDNNTCQAWLSSSHDDGDGHEYHGPAIISGGSGIVTGVACSSAVSLACCYYEGEMGH